MFTFTWCLVWVSATLVAGFSDLNAPRLVDDEGKPVTIYHGEIAERSVSDNIEETEVTLSPVLKAVASKGGKICGFDILHAAAKKEPFMVVSADVKGAGKIVLKKNERLNYEHRKKYKFHIRAFDCDKRVSKKAVVIIRVIDKDEYGPVFDKPSYYFKINEGVIRKLGQLHATDKDASPVYHTICSYELINKNLPFKIDKEGNIWNTAKFVWAHERNYILQVQAEDCGHVKSKVVIVNVEVTKSCKPGWTGIEESIDYEPGTRSVPLFQQASFNKCAARCTEKKVTAHIQLNVKDGAQGCERDMESILTQRKQCGANAKSVDLLPSPSKKDSWTKGLPYNYNGDEVFHFDGKTAVQVPEGKVDHTLTKSFAISMWMKHKQDKKFLGAKEHILCNADGAKMNRHHYSLFVHNCRLVLLLRQEAKGAKSLNTFKPAEYRWKIPEVCDGKWHHYTINGQFPDMTLHIDGNLFVANTKNPEIIDDWPMHPTVLSNTKLMIGACFAGGKHKIEQYFNGDLAGLTLLKGHTEKENVLKCLNNCQEKLDFHSMKEMATGMTVSFNKEMSEMTINGNKMSDIQHLIRSIGYVNTRLNPKQGKHLITLNTYIRCKELRLLKIPDVKSYVVVKETKEPTIIVDGPSHVKKTRSQFEVGVYPFEKVTLTIQKDKIHETMFKKNEAASVQELEGCFIKTKPALFKSESLLMPKDIMDDAGLTHDYYPMGVNIFGSEEASSFQKVIRAIKYINSIGEPSNRVFSVECSEKNRKVISNSFKVMLDIIKEVHIPRLHFAKSVHAEKSHSETLELEEDKKSLQNLHHHHNKKTSGTTIAVICLGVGFLMFMIVLGVVRIRSTHRKTTIVQVEDNEPEWDDAGLTIRVNPLDETLENENYDETLAGVHGDDSDSDDDIGSYHDDLESSEDESEKIKDRDLEWDNSTLSF